MLRKIAFCAVLALLIAWVAGASAQGTLNPQQLRKLLPEDGAANDNFGNVIQVADTRAAIAASTEVGGPSKVYIFDIATGEELFTFSGDNIDTSDSFGITMDIDGSRVIIGANKDDSIEEGSGAAYVYDIFTGERIQKLVPENPYEFQGFGADVAIAGQYALVGSLLEETGRGAAYVFDIDTGAQLRRIAPADRNQFAVFGVAVELDGTTAYIGAQWDDDNGFDSGAVYVFDVLTGQQIDKFSANDTSGDDGFGSNIILDEGRLFIAADGEGAGYIFDQSTRTQLRKIPQNGGAAASFDTTAFSWPYVLMGAGEVQIFDASTGQALTTICPDTWQSSDFYVGVGIDGNLAIVGAPSDDDNGADSGSAYVFDLLGLATPAEADDLHVTALDAIQVRNRIPNNATGLEAFDVNGDGVIDAADFDAVMSLLGQSVPVEP